MTALHGPIDEKARGKGYTCPHGTDETTCVEHDEWRACCCPHWHAKRTPPRPVRVEYHRPWWKAWSRK
jgi:hypothetical protein